MTVRLEKTLREQIAQLEAEKAELLTRVEVLEHEVACHKKEKEQEKQLLEQEGHRFSTKRITDYGNGLPSWDEGRTLQTMCSSFLLTDGCSALEAEMVNSMPRKFNERNAPKPMPEARPKAPVYTDEQVARAITAICGKGKPLDSKRKWAAVYWYLRWEANYPVSVPDFCQRIATLPFPADLPYRCDYVSIRHDATALFMKQDAREVDLVKPSNTERALYQECRYIVLALSRALEAEAKV
ncbi:MAG: hypothetical protein IKN48_03500 [Bacteroidaceae bacterium]|nr:hypothetical protein [Bacteroidaceae bacterium]